MQLNSLNNNQWGIDQINPFVQKLSGISNCESERSAEEVFDMLKMLSHDIRSPLVTIGATIKLLKRGAYGKINEKADTELEKLLMLVIQAKRVMEDLMGIACSLSEADSEHIEFLHIGKDIYYPVIFELKKILEERKITLCSEGFDVIQGEKPITSGNRFLLKSVFRNLINNAVRYGGRGCKIYCSLVIQNSFNRISIFNTGRSLTEKEQLNLFKNNRKVQNAEENAGMGMALFLIKEIITKNGGSIWYEAYTGGSKFIFTLPR